VAEVGQPSGACFVVAREVWEAMGGLDEGFFLWYEDVDLAKRLHDAGYRNLIAGAARVGHAGAEAFVQIDRREQQAIRLRSVERYIRLHHPRAMPVAAPLLRLSRRLRAGGAQ
jgi:N-acetylglucosaminyl-diphospho-decaprenol L-rhamnosyltransferase